MAKKEKKEVKNYKRIAIISAVVAVIVLIAFLTYLSISVKQLKDQVPTCTPQWTCTGWSECINEQMTRSCSDVNNCNTTEEKPSEEQACEFQGINVEVGKELVSYSISYKINRITTEEKIGEAAAKGLYYIIEMTIENRRAQSLTLSTLPFKLNDSLGKEYTYDSNAESYYDVNGIKAINTSTKFMPNAPVTGVKIFDLPRDSSGLKFKIECCDLVSKSEYIDLGY